MLISLIIPTRERSQFLRESVKTALAVRDADVEIVVSDNASLDDTREVIAEFQDTRLKYVNTGNRVSMRQNFEFALENSSGDYVMYIGDDDAFLPRQIPWLQQILEQERPEVCTWPPLTYGWPIPGFAKRTGGVRLMRNNIFGRPQQIDLSRKAELLKQARMLDLGCMPSIYRGCASRDFLRRIKDRVGASFGSTIPDFFFTYHVTLTAPSFLYIVHPFTIGGHSPVSTGNAHHAYHSKDERIKPAVRFGEEASIDPRQDVVEGFAPSIPINLYSTFETVCSQLNIEPNNAGREAWYRYVLTKTNSSDPQTYATVVDMLEAYAEKTGSQPALHAAKDLRGSNIRYSKVRNFLHKAWTRSQSVKLSAARNGTNTVFTAAQMVDEMLASDYQKVLGGELPPLMAYTRLMRRAAKRRDSPHVPNEPIGASGPAESHDDQDKAA